MMRTRFIVRKFNSPLRFPQGKPVEQVPSDGEATGFESREEAIDELRKRRMGHKGIAIVEVPAETVNHE